MVEREGDAPPLHGRPVGKDCDRAAGRILFDRLVARAACELTVELQLEAGEPYAVDADIPQHLCRHRPLGIVAPLVR